jgi:hypothetical protein
MKSGKTFLGRVWLKKGGIVDDDDDDDDDDDYYYYYCYYYLGVYHSSISSIEVNNAVNCAYIPVSFRGVAN